MLFIYFFLYICRMEDLFNWKQVSKRLAGNEGSIRKNRIPLKYKRDINDLLKLTEYWFKNINDL